MGLGAENCSGHCQSLRTSHIKLFQVGWGNAFLQQAIKDTGRVIPSILAISKGDKCFKNQTPFQIFRSVAMNEIVSVQEEQNIKTH